MTDLDINMRRNSNTLPIPAINDALFINKVEKGYYRLSFNKASGGFGEIMKEDGKWSASFKSKGLFNIAPHVITGAKDAKTAAQRIWKYVSINASSNSKGAFNPQDHKSKDTEPKFKPSKYQQGIFDWCINGTGNGIVKAVAGSGKTTSLVQAAQIISKATPKIRGLQLVFSKRIQRENADKFEGTRFTVRTCHSLGFACVRKVFPRTQVDNSKYRKIVKTMLNAAIKAGRAHQSLPWLEDWQRDAVDDQWPMSEICKLLDLVQATLTTPSDRASVLSVADHYGVEIPNGLENFCCDVVMMACQQGEDTAAQCISYSDMVWLPSFVPGMDPNTFDWVLVDECQDLTTAQRRLAMSACGVGGRMLFVGDRNQSIFGFAGADTESVDMIEQEAKTQSLPLSICYRCPSSHLDLAREIVPEIEDAPNAKEGEIQDINKEKMFELAGPGSLILCRNTAPLIAACFGFIRSGKRARVVGRSIGEGLCALLRKTTKDDPNLLLKDLASAVDGYMFDAVTAILMSNGDDEDDPRIQAVQDKCRCLVVIAEDACKEAVNRRQDMSTHPFQLEAMQSRILAIFGEVDDRWEGIDLSTVHRAKGLEADTVFILDPSLMPSPFAQLDWQREQEAFLEYVALTRSKQSLFFVIVPR